MTTQRRTGKTIAATAVVSIVIALVLGVAAYASVGGFGNVFANLSVPAPQEGQHQVTDSVGRKVNVPDNPENIAAMDSFAGTVAVLCGAGDSMMGAPGGVISNEMLAQVYPDLKNLVKLAGDSVNAETMLASKVDVVFVKRSFYEGDQMSSLEALGVPYVVVDYDTVEQQMDAIELVGDTIGGDAAKKAEGIVAEYQDVLDTVQQRVGSLGDDQKPRVYHSINAPLLTDGKDSLGADWIARCGAVNVSAGEQGTGGEGDYTATIEQVYAWNPDVIVCNTVQAKEEILKSEQWAGLEAVKQGRVYNMPVSTSRWGQRGDPETFLGVLWLATTLYPDEFSDVNLQEQVTAYYHDVIGLSVDDGLWKAIVSGEGLRAQGTGDKSGGA